MKKISIRRLVMCALFAALSYVATLLPIPVPMLHGYVNIGDCMVLLCAFMLGGLFGAFSVGAGTALADITLSFALYAPATFVIKTLMAFVAYLFFRKSGILMRAVGCVVAEAIMVLGYFIFEYFLYGMGALASVTGNLIQAGTNAIIAFVLISFFSKDKNLKKLTLGNEKSGN